MAIEAQSFYAGSIDVQVSKPLDAREYVKTEGDLIKEDTWTSLRGGSYLWKGMRTYVKDVGCWYELISEPYGDKVVIGKDEEENDIKGYPYQLLKSWKKLNNIAIDDSSTSNETTYSSSKIQSLIASINKFNIQVVETLPETGEKFVIYLVPIQEISEQDETEEPTTQISDTYNEYIWTTDEDGENGKWELIGTTNINLSDYYTKTEVDTFLDSVNTSVDALDSRITTAVGNITTLQGEITTKAAQEDLTVEVEAREALAERVTTTEGEIDSLQTTKANASDVYTKTEVDTIVSNIEDKDTTYTAGENIEIEDNSISATGYTFERGSFCINKNGEKVVINKNRNDFDWIIPYEDNQSTLISYVGSDENYDFNEIIIIGDKIIFYDEGSGIINPYIECSVIEINPKNFLVDKKIYLSPTTTSVYKPGFVAVVKNNGDVYIKGIGGYGDENEVNQKSLQEYLLEQKIKVVNVYELSSSEYYNNPLVWPDADLYHYCDTSESDVFLPEKSLYPETYGIKPNTFYRWINTVITDGFHISFDSSDYNEYNEYMAEFKVGTTNTSISFGRINGGNIIFTDNSDLQTIAGKTYQLSVLNNIGVLINA